MIKFIAASLMLIDHIGAILCPNIIILRIVGRLAMPLFAYCIARGFYYSDNKGTLNRYAKYLVVFAVLSQIPYYFFRPDRFNIGFTWLLALPFLYLISYELKRRNMNEPFHKFTGFSYAVVILFICVTAVLLPVDYSLAGVLFPAMFYLSIYFFRRFDYAFIGTAIIFAVSVLTYYGNMIQVFTLLAIPLLALLMKHDDKIRINKWVYYVFYPLHISVLLILKTVLDVFSL
jgi:hypothetical protein